MSAAAQKPSGIVIYTARKAIERQIEIMRSNSNAKVWLRSYPDQEDAGADKLFSSIADAMPWIKEQEKQQRAIGIVVGEGGNKNDEITNTDWLYIDQDGDGSPLTDTQFHMPPDLIVKRTDQKFHAFWKVCDCPVDKFRDAQKRLIAHYNSDTSKHSPAGVMRLAGSKHQKDLNNPVRLVLLDNSANTTHDGLGNDLKDLMAGLPELPPRNDKAESKLKGDPVTASQLREALSYANPSMKYNEGFRDIIAGIGCTNCPEAWDIAHEFAEGKLDRQKRGTPANYHGPNPVDLILSTMKLMKGGVGTGTVWKICTDAGAPPNIFTPRKDYPQAVIDKLTEESKEASETKPGKRVIQIQGGALPENTDDAEAALIESKADIYQRGELLVRPGEIAIEVRNGKKVHDKLLVQVRRPELIEIMTSAAQFVRYDARMDALKPIDCPPAVADTYLGRIGRQNVRPLMGILNAPTLRPDGSLLDAPGYDDATGLLYDPRGVEFPAIPSHPTKDDALRALKVFDELIGKFPFADKKAKAVALAAILTACIRKTLPSAPIFGIDGTGAGSGKGLLADTVATIGGGRASSPITAGPHEEELEKRIASLLIRGDHSICIDNLNDPLESSFLCSALTQPTQSVRVLGQSRVVTTPTNSLFLTTGNGLTFSGDLWRRGLISLIDPAMERPSERQFDFDPLERAKANRPRYVAAALTILRAYQVAGSPKQKGRPMGSFDVWTRTVRDPLLWLGEADPVETCVMPADDPERERFGAVVTAWQEIIGEGRGVTLKEAIKLAVEAATAQPSRPELFDAFHSIAAPMVRGDDKIDGRRLAYWLRSKKRLVTNGFRLMPADGAGGGVLRWRLEKVAGRSP